MAIGDITAGLLEIFGRFIWHTVVEFLFEMLVKGVGYFIAARVFRMRMPDPDGLAVIVCGLTFWVVAGYAFYELLSRS